MEKFIHEFGIDWKLMIAQLINFAVLVFVLAKFVYKPILRVLDERRKKIEEGVAFSEKAKAELASVETLKAETLHKAEAQSVEIVKRAEASGQSVREGIIQEAEVEKDKLIATGKALLAEHKVRLEKGVFEEAVQLVEMSLGKVLGKAKFDREDQQLIQETISEIKVGR